MLLLRSVGLLSCVFLLFACASSEVQPPQGVDQSTTATPITRADLLEQQLAIIQENFASLQREQEELRKEVLELRQTKNEYKQQLAALEKQYEINFSLLEKSVDRRLSQQQNAPKPFPQKKEKIVSEKPNTVATFQKTVISPKTSSPLIENYSLFSTPKTTNPPPVSSNKTEPITKNEPETTVENTETPKFVPLPLPPVSEIIDETKRTIPKEQKSQTSQVIAPMVKKPFDDPDLQEPSDPIVLKRHPGVKKLYNEGMLALTQHQYAKAIKILQSFAKQFPDDFDTDNAYYWMGYAYFELGNFKNAKKSLKLVLRKYEHRPTSQGYKTPDTIYLLGKIALQDKQPAQAKFYYQKVIELFPTSASARKAEGDLSLL